MKQQAETLAKEYELGNTKDDFFNYILESLINGQRQQMKDLFNMMKGEDKKTFLVDYLEDDNGIQKSCKNILISELI
tara:strand:+ start:922 stop:1152 length:231 start_codon:yes stop_codon:yes gene_type:complete